MVWQRAASPSRVSPFRTAAASVGRPHIIDKLVSRPVVAAAMAPERTTTQEQRDASLSGMTRSLRRRVSGLNLPVAQRTPAA